MQSANGFLFFVFEFRVGNSVSVLLIFKKVPWCTRAKATLHVRLREGFCEFHTCSVGVGILVAGFTGGRVGEVESRVARRTALLVA